MILQVFWTIPSVLNIMHMVKLFSMNLNQMAKVSLLMKKIKKNMSGSM
uniref:Alternative protein SMURF2 n=1 Tax=Homo sapiens TaxID=9606 RepID=L8EAC0_HUMAN|nr:alternative protein SMURF2 [Homo sapiens]